MRGHPYPRLFVERAEPDPKMGGIVRDTRINRRAEIETKGAECTRRRLKFADMLAPKQQAIIPHSDRNVCRECAPVGAAAKLTLAEARFA